MGLFDRFKKKKEPDYDPLNITVEHLKKGFILEYDLKTWEVTAEYTYDWGDNCFSKEFQIKSGNDVLYLSIEKDDELELTLTRKIKIRELEANIPEHIAQYEKPPKNIAYNGETYLLDGESPGYFHDEDDKKDTWIEFISWDYYNKAETAYLCVEQWGENEFEAAEGKLIKPFEISNILPKE